MPRVFVDLVEANFFGIAGGRISGYRATGQVTSETRRKPFQLTRGAMDATSNYATDSGLKRDGASLFRVVSSQNLVEPFEMIAVVSPWNATHLMKQ
jgi:hypothetical protein